MTPQSRRMTVRFRNSFSKHWNFKVIKIHLNIIWPGGGSVWRGFPAVGDTTTPPACVGQGLKGCRSCDRAQLHRCSPEGTTGHRGTQFQSAYVSATEALTLHKTFNTHSVCSMHYFILLVRNFPWVAKTGGVLGDSSSHCREIVYGTKTEIL